MYDEQVDQIAMCIISESGVSQKKYQYGDANYSKNKIQDARLFSWDDSANNWGGSNPVQRYLKVRCF